MYMEVHEVGLTIFHLYLVSQYLIIPKLSRAFVSVSNKHHLVLPIGTILWPDSSTWSELGQLLSTGRLGFLGDVSEKKKSVDQVLDLAWLIKQAAAY